MNVVIYARFSSHSQTEQSIEGQLKECYAYAQRNDYMVVGEYIDRALSGTTDHRPEFQKMIADSSKKTFQGVLVYQLDRFARNRYDSATYKSKLKKNGVRVLSARENISDDASGVLMEAVLEGMAEYYSVELAQKIKRGMDINAEKCLSTGGNVALGFKIEDKRIVIDPVTAPVVVKIFEMYVAGSTMADIIRGKELPELLDHHVLDVFFVDGLFVAGLVPAVGYTLVIVVFLFRLTRPANASHSGFTVPAEQLCGKQVIHFSLRPCGGLFVLFHNALGLPE